MIGGSFIVWKSKLQQTHQKSSMGAELVSVTNAIDHTVYIGLLWRGMTNQDALVHCKIDAKDVLDPVVVRSKTTPKDKSLVLNLAHLRETVQRQMIKMSLVSSDDNLVDELTKAMSQSKFS